MENPHSVRADPRNPTGYYIVDQVSIRYFDEAKDRVTLFAGGDVFFGRLRALIVSSCGSTIWCTDSRGMHRIDTATREISIVLSGHKSWWMCWDRSVNTGIKPDSAFYFHAVGVWSHFKRFDTTANREVKSYSLQKTGDYVTDAVCTQSGHLLLSVQNESYLYEFDPITSKLERIESIALDAGEPLVLIDSTRTLITQSLGVITAFTLPPQYFALKKCCERDL